MCDQSTIATREEATVLLVHDGWKLIHSDRFIRPASSFEIWAKKGYPYQLRLQWPVNGDCNGATTTQIEINKLLHFLDDARLSTTRKEKRDMAVANR